LTDVKDYFSKSGFLNSFDFFCIIIWKANRAKSKIANRLLTINPDLDEGVKDLTNEIYKANDNKEKLKILIEDFGFRLPMASAILSLLYPDHFTIYDIRVCDTFPNYKGLDNLIFEKLWVGYQNYIEDVKNYDTQNLSLRDKDRLLWGKSFYEQLNSDLKTKFKKEI
jgi:hypothetical protein